MFYVSDRRKEGSNILYGITDTISGVTDYVDINDIKSAIKSGVQIQGVENGKIHLVDVGNTVVTPLVDNVKQSIGSAISTWTYEQCEDLARKGGFVRKLKPYADDPEGCHKLVMERLFPQGIQDVISQANEYTNTIRQVDITNMDAVKQALSSNMCLSLQIGSKGNLSTFICTSSIAVLDSIYGDRYFDTFYLTKKLYGYTYNIEHIRPDNSLKQKNENYKVVFSGSLRFRNSGKNHDGIDKDLSSPMYTLNLGTLIGLFVLDNPSGMSRYNVVNEYNDASRKNLYNFDLNLWNDVLRCCKDGKNYFTFEEKFLQYVDTEHLTKAIDYKIPISRFDKDFYYMLKLRKEGFSFK